MGDETVSGSPRFCNFAGFATYQKILTEKVSTASKLFAQPPNHDIEVSLLVIWKEVIAFTSSIRKIPFAEVSPPSVNPVFEGANQSHPGPARHSQ